MNNWAKATANGVKIIMGLICSTEKSNASRDFLIEIAGMSCVKLSQLALARVLSNRGEYQFIKDGTDRLCLQSAFPLICRVNFASSRSFLVKSLTQFNECHGHKGETDTLWQLASKALEQF